MKYLMLYALLLLTLASCSLTDTEPNLPPETTTGENTAGFIVDGKTVVLPKDKYSSVPGNGTIRGLYAQFGPNFGTNGDDYFSLVIENVGDTKTFGIHLRMNNMLNGEGSYLLGQNNGDYYYDGPDHPQITLITGGKDVETKWYYSSEGSGNINLTKVDNENYYYAGTFECSLYNKNNPSEIIKITKGRFDINARTLNK